MILKVPSCLRVLGFDSHVKGYQCHSNQLLALAWVLTQSPGQEYSSDQSEQCCTWSRQRLLGIQPQYLKTVEGQRHHPGPQGGHSVTRGTRANGVEAAVSWSAPNTRTLPGSDIGHGSLKLHATWHKLTVFLISVWERESRPQLIGCMTSSKSLTSSEPQFPHLLKVVIKEECQAHGQGSKINAYCLPSTPSLHHPDSATQPT